MSIYAPGRRYEAVVMIGPRSEGIRHDLEDFGAPAKGNSIRCSGFAHAVDFDSDRVILTVPRSCLRDPPWVRLRFQNFTASAQATVAVFLDNPHNATATAGSARFRRLFPAP